jgi:FAD/FMN-containing dehydrogenase
VPVTIRNWKRSIEYRADCIVVVSSAKQIAAVVKDSESYSSPVRARGSHHSTTDCIVAEGGTVIDMRQMSRIIEINPDELTISMEAGVRHIDAARALEQRGLQFYVNVEIGNLTIGSGACGGTKDASYVADGETEYGQVASYCIGAKMVQADGGILEVTESDGELLEMVRSSYGMLGIIFEATYRVKRIKPMAVEHASYAVEEFVERLDELLAGGRSMMLYLFPFLDKVVVEYRFDGSGPIRGNSWQWRLRNWVWKTGSPGFASFVTSCIPGRRLRSWILDCWNGLSALVMTTLLRGCNSSPADQIILYPETAGFASYTFSIWAFPRESYGETLLAYFQFCRDYFDQSGYRCDLLNVGYSIAHDRQSTFSYSRNGPVLTIDPVSTGSVGWVAFLQAYNEFCSDHGGTPLFNQTRGLTAVQTHKAFSSEIKSFLQYRERCDPERRFYTAYFEDLFEPE